MAARDEKKKAEERAYVLAAGKLLGQGWEIAEEGEVPDFLIRENGKLFGLEVTEIFSGEIKKFGSVRRREIAIVQNRIVKAQQCFAAEDDTLLSVRFVGNVTEKTLDLAVETLLSKRLGDKQIGHHEVIELEGRDHGPVLRVHVTKAFRAEWFDVHGRIGWTHLRPTDRLHEAVREKANKIEKYRERAGRDVRLLVISNQFRGSGMFRLENARFLSTKPFTTVYWLSDPEALLVFDGKSRRRKRLIYSHR